MLNLVEVEVVEFAYMQLASLALTTSNSLRVSIGSVHRIHPSFDIHDRPEEAGV